MKLIILLGSLVLASLALADEVTFFHGKDAIKLQALPYVNPPYVNFFQFLRGLGAEPQVRDKQIEVEINKRKLAIDLEAGLARFNKKDAPFPLRLKDGQYFARVDMLSEIFSDLLGRALIYDESTRSLHLPLSRELVVKLRSRRLDDGYRLILVYSDAVGKPTIKVEGRKMVLRIKEKSIQLDRSAYEDTEAIEKVQVFSDLPDGSTEILFVLAPEAKKWFVEPFAPENPRTVIKFTGDFKAVKGDKNKEQGAHRKIARIAIDPGHGGVDKGAVGPTGLQEKDVALDLALRLEKALTPDYEVVLTRREDTLIPLKTRTAIANRFNADLLISVHVNATLLSSAMGSETYYLSMDADVPDPHYQESDNGAKLPEDDLTLILWDAAQAKSAEDSLIVAKHIQDNLNLACDIPSRGVKQASLKVLKGATMPAVLVEVGFISNPAEEARLFTGEFREKLVDAIQKAVRRFDEDVRKRAKADTE